MATMSDDEKQSRPWHTMRRKPASPFEDIGPAVLASLYERLMIDDGWAIRDARSFTWWPFRLAQRVVVTEARDAFGDPTVSLRVENDFIRDVRVEDQVVSNLVEAFNLNASLVCYIWEPESRKIRIGLTAYIHEGNRSVEAFFSAAVVMSTVEAHAKVLQVAEYLDAQVDDSAHPSSGMRAEMGDLLNFADHSLVPAGQGESAFVGDYLEGAGNTVNASWVLRNTSTTGFTGELPFFCWMPAAAGEPGAPIETSLVELITDARHPGYGSGLLSILHLPLSGTQIDFSDVAARLNRSEMLQLTGVPLLGAWCSIPRSEDSLGFISFLPSRLFDPGLADIVLGYAALRNEWAREQLLQS